MTLEEIGAIMADGLSFADRLSVLACIAFCGCDVCKQVRRAMVRISEVAGPKEMEAPQKDGFDA
jgi:hypothetical protein